MKIIFVRVLPFYSLGYLFFFSSAFFFFKVYFILTLWKKYHLIETKHVLLN